MAEVVEKGRDGIRGKDRAKKANWKAVENVYQFDDGVWVGDVKDVEDLTLLGRMGGGCSASHVWGVNTAKNENIMAVFDQQDVPKCVLHFLNLGVAWMDLGRPPDGGYGNLTYCGSINDKSKVKWLAGESEESSKHYLELARTYSRYAEVSKNAYEELKKRALDAGVLGPNNPYKSPMDNENRRKEEYKQLADKYGEMGKTLRIEEKKDKTNNPQSFYTQGRRIVFQGRQLILIYAGGGAKNAWSERASLWMDTLPEGETEPIAHAALAAPVVCPTIRHLAKLVRASKDSKIAINHIYA